MFQYTHCITFWKFEKFCNPGDQIREEEAAQCLGTWAQPKALAVRSQGLLPEETAPGTAAPSWPGDLYSFRASKPAKPPPAPTPAQQTQPPLQSPWKALEWIRIGKWVQHQLMDEIAIYHLG